jgi:hypothetical protein
VIEIQTKTSPEPRRSTSLMLVSPFSIKRLTLSGLPRKHAWKIGELKGLMLMDLSKTCRVGDSRDLDRKWMAISNSATLGPNRPD